MTSPIRTTLLGAAVALMLTACATAGSTFGSGVGDRELEHPPWYAGAYVQPGTAVGHFPIFYQRGATQPAMFDLEAGAGTPMAALVAEMNAYLDSLGASVRIAANAPQGTPPDVQFGCRTDPLGECTREETSGAPATGQPTMRLAVGRPSQSWTTWAAGEMRATNVTRTLVLTLEVGQYWPRQSNLRGDKIVELGTRHTASVPWLTALDSPVSVLQLTGALMDSGGKAVRIGAEGLIAKRTPLVLSALGVQELLTDEDVEQLRGARRDDLPGQPLVWKVALRNLVAELTGRREMAAQ